jgi:4-amino-4-deoxy-L-arabinose transferase-like glycosyltransferase
MSTTTSTPTSVGSVPPSGARRFADRPAVARAALLLILAAATVLCTWGIDRSKYHVFYASAVRSMTLSPRAFFYGSFDPGNAITIDKLPGYLWPQALSAEIFGFHAWALVLPQAVECVAAVLVLHVVVRRWAGTAPALLAAALFTITPVVVGLGRSIVEDAPFTLLLLLAAEATQRAVATARLRTLMLAGLWVGLAFQCKMLEAWAVLPALAGCYLLAAPATLRRRAGHLALAGAVTVAVSLSWLAVASLTPAADRPYIDGTTDNSPFSMVFGYNFLTRFDTVGLDAAGTGSVTTTQHTGLSALAKMFSPGIATQSGWLYPLAALGLGWGLAVAWRRRVPRTDRALAGYVMWGVWLLTFFAAFSFGSVAGHTYYMGVVAVPLAVLAADGLVRGWRTFTAGGRYAWALPIALAVNVLWCVVVTWRYHTFLTWLIPAAVAACALAMAVLWFARGSRIGTAALVLAVCSALLAPAAWSASALDPRYNLPGGMARVGPTSPQGTGGAFALNAAQRRLLAYLRAHRDGATYLAAVPMWTDTTPYVLDAGAPLLPMGGFTGQVPFPTLKQFRRMVDAGRLHYVIPHGSPLGRQARSSTGRVMAWVAAHCVRVTKAPAGTPWLYRCDAGH